MIATCTPEDLRVWRRDGASEALARRLGCGPLLASLLCMRGKDEALAGRELGVSPLEEALEGVQLGSSLPRESFLDLIAPGKEVVVYGDYDVDGVTATALAVEMCLSRGANVRYYIPHRHLKGYGLHKDMVDRIMQRGCDLLVVVDCGTHDRASHQAARDAGVPTWIFDHHFAEGQEVPDAPVVLVNPQMGGNEEGRTLSAAGVLWVWAWQTGAMPRPWLKNQLDLVALSTVADCAPLGAVNRMLVARGLDCLRSGHRRGIALLAERLDVRWRHTSEEDLSMKIIPCLNAAGRLDLADVALRVLLEDKDQSAWMERLVALNRRRQLLSSQLVEEINPQVGASGCVLRGKGWPVGVLSSVASRLCSQHRKPVILSAQAGPILRGTVRMPPGGDAVRFLSGLSPHLLAWGGHRLAAGFSAAPESWEILEQAMTQELSSLRFSPECLDVLEVDPETVTPEAWREVGVLGPFGTGNPSPLFFCPFPSDSVPRPFGTQGAHVKIPRGRVDIVAFYGTAFFGARPALRGLVYRPRLDHWRGSPRMQFVLERAVV